jgi:uncharacterized membrane protein
MELIQSLIALLFFGNAMRDPLDRLPRGVQVERRAARRGGIGGAVLGAIAGFAVFVVFLREEPRRDEVTRYVLEVYTGALFLALLCVVVGALLGGALGYAVGEAVGARRRREVEGGDR